MAMTGYTSKLVKTGILNNGTSGVSIKLYVAYKSTQNVSKNQSTVYCGMYFTISNSDYNIGRWGDNSGSYVGTTKLTFDGTVPANTTGTYWLVENKSFTVNHNADGTGSTKIYWKWGVNSTWGQMVTPSGSFTYTLPTIPRASSITATNANIESATTITINRASSSFTHTLQYKIGTQTSYTNIVSKTTATSYKWTIPTAAYDYVSSTGKTVSISINCITYNGSTKIGEAAKTITATCSSSKCAPTLSPTVVDAGKISTVLTGDVNKVIKYYNNISYKIGATAKNGATIKSQKITCGNKSATAASGNISYAESNKFTITATDSRGFSSSTTITKTLVDYVKITCALTAEAKLATDSSGNSTTTLTVKASGKWFNGSFGAVTNALTVQYRYKTNNGSYGSWTAMTVTKSGNTYTATKSITGLDYQSTYTVEVRAYDSIHDNGASDNFGLAQPAAKTVSAKPVFDWSKSDFNFNVPVKMPNNNYYSQTDKTGGGLNMNNSDVVGCNGIYFADRGDSGGEGLFFPTNDTDGTYDVLQGYAAQLYFMPQYPNKTTKYKMLATPGDVISIVDNTPFTGYISNGKKTIFFTIPINKPIVGVSSVTLDGAFELRGITGYLYNPKTLEATCKAYTDTTNGVTVTPIATGSVIHVHITFEDTVKTNAEGTASITNNTPIVATTYGTLDIKFN